MWNSFFVMCGCIDQASIGVVEKWGRSDKLASPGLHFFNLLAGEWLPSVLFTRINSLEELVGNNDLPSHTIQLSETYPSKTYTVGTYLSRNTNMLDDFIGYQSFMYLPCKFKGWLFVAFGVIAAVMLLFVYFFLPETSGMSDDEMKNVWRKHWYWSRFMEQEGNA